MKPIADDKVTSLDFNEIVELANTIREVITNDKPLSLNDMIKNAKKISSHKLGYRLSRAIKHEKQVAAFLPHEVYKVLFSKRYFQPTFNEIDKKFILKHTDKEIKWLASRFYTDVKHIRDMMIKKNLRYNNTVNFHKYTEEEDAFISNSLKQGISHRQIGLSLGVSKSALQKHIKRVIRKNKTPLAYVN